MKMDGLIVLTIPRELELKGDKLIQKPVRELRTLREDER